GCLPPSARNSGRVQEGQGRSSPLLGRSSHHRARRRLRRLEAPQPVSQPSFEQQRFLPTKARTPDGGRDCVKGVIPSSHCIPASLICALVVPQAPSLAQRCWAHQTLEADQLLSPP